MESIPKTIGPYEIQGEIGRGGTALVYRAMDTRNGQTLALKVMPPEFALQPTFLQRFLKEGENAVRLRHPNIVEIYEAGKADDYHYIAMEYVPGGTLSDYVRKRDTLLPLVESLDILAQVGDALDYAHAQGFVHRDIKMSNILMGEKGRIVLADFGVAKNFVGEDSVLTATGYRVGTPTYMSPEQITGNQGLDQRSDVYSFGVMAYTLFTGRPPFRSDNQAELLYKVVHETPPSPDIMNPELPPHIVQAVNRVLSKEPTKRFSSVFEFVTALVKPPSVLNFGSLTSLDEATISAKRTAWIKQLVRKSLAFAAVVLLLFLGWSYRNHVQSQAARLYQSGVEPRVEQVSKAVANYTDPKQNPSFWDVQPIDWYRLNNIGQEYGIALSTGPLKRIWVALGHFRFSADWVSETWQSIFRSDSDQTARATPQPASAEGSGRAQKQIIP